MKFSEYNILDRSLHHIALGSHLVRRTSLEVDLIKNKNKYANSNLESPVYILGLARAGTTILLEALYSTGIFASFTYRHMPFVLAPGLWSRFSSGHRMSSSLTERKHGDNLQVGYDSPEAFEEVFWLTYSGKNYIKTDRLDKYLVNDEVLDIYRKYIANFLAINVNRNYRYLAKNNNNILRISSLLKIFPDGCYIVPFRNPVAHSRSLLQQHLRFIEIHSQDKFSLKYMNWLGHYEFGMNFKPMDFGENIIPQEPEELCTEEYWIRYWTSVYKYLLNAHGNEVVFFDYDFLCRYPEKTLEKLANQINVDSNSLLVFKDKIRPTNNNVTNIGSGETSDVYESLLSKSLQAN